MKTKDKQQFSFKEMINRLDDISNSLDNDDLDLEAAIALYEEGVMLSEECIKSLKSAELKISALKEKLDVLQA